MTSFQIDISGDTGRVELWMETESGLRPIIAWADLEGVKEFADMLLEFYYRRKDEVDKRRKISDDLIWQALDKGNTEEGTK